MSDHVKPSRIHGKTLALWSQAALSSPQALIFITAVYLAGGMLAMVAWLVSGDTKWVERFFRVPGAILMIWLALVQVLLSARVWSNYSTSEPMHRAWMLISASALAELSGTVLIQVPGFQQDYGLFGHFLGGTLRFGLLAAGLSFALGVYRRAGFLGRETWWQWLTVAAAAAFAIAEVAGVVKAVLGGKRPGVWEMLGWPVDPLLCILLAQAFLLRNSVWRMGRGWIGRGWLALSAGVFLILLGNVGTLAEAYGYLQWPWNSVVWYLWIPASCAFAVAPAYQLDAIQRATAAAPRH